MADQIETLTPTFTVERLSRGRTILEALAGGAIAIGLALLWMLERVRDSFFVFLDKVGLKPWPRRASAFPPGRPRKLK